ncbi:hypothetical protein, partial [Microcoleus sp. Pol12B5]|uniref:hypothetical protein n=1 Tax=Microcoleus sp. Pol12B5 TaxID=3055396 RepID=UPI002FD54740
DFLATYRIKHPVRETGFLPSLSVIWATSYGWIALTFNLNLGGRVLYKTNLLIAPFLHRPRAYMGLFCGREFCTKQSC